MTTLTAIRFYLTLALISVLSSCYAKDVKEPDMFTSLSNIVQQAKQVDVAQLRIVNAESVISNALTSSDLIAGYPIQSQTKSLSQDDTKELASIILNPQHYADILQRCVNKSLVGVRFTKNKEIAEFAYGMPCQQAFWAFKVDGKVQFWSAVLGGENGQQLLKILSK